jgi:hypothetical protein
MNNAKAPNFATNYGWVTSNMTAFKPRYVNEVVRNMLCQTLILNDAAFRQVLRQCKGKWILAVTLGKDTVSMKIYDPADVDQSHQHPISSSVARHLTSFFEIDRNFDMRPLTSDRVDEVMRTAPMLYADRSLKQSEVDTCDGIERAMTAPGENATVTMSVEHKVVPDDSTTIVLFDTQQEIFLESAPALVD